MDLSNVMMLWNFLLALYIVYADVIREDGYHNYEGQFTVKHRGRMLRVLMSFKNVEMGECALHCVRHLRCRTYNYHHGKKDCELTDEVFYEMDVDTISHGWYNHGTPKRVNGGWSNWRNFTECTKTCGDGTLDQYRECDSPTPAHGGANCYGKMTRRVKCYIRSCPVDGGLSNWKNSTNCTKPCGNGTMEQIRHCDSPKPEHGGANCTGKRIKTVECNTQACPVRATQSSTWANNANYSPSKAVDGDKNTRAITKIEPEPWLQVDLGDVKVIKEIRLYSIVNMWNNLGLLVETRTKTVENWRRCNIVGDVKNHVTFQCHGKTTNARYLRIRSTGTCRLDFSEVEIVGY